MNKAETELVGMVVMCNVAFSPARDHKTGIVTIQTEDNEYHVLDVDDYTEMAECAEGDYVRATATRSQDSRTWIAHKITRLNTTGLLDVP
ncbi:MAG: hypothetical protein QXS20_03450 [Candidatus Thorarchaeota archaeon]